MEELTFLKNPVVIWFLVGLLCALLELAIPGLVLIFFGIGAWITALASLFLPIGIAPQIILFVFASVISLVIFRKRFKNRFFQEDTNSPDTLADEFIGHTAIVIQNIEPDNPGQVEFKGANWTAMSQSAIKKGQHVEIINKESIKLIVKPVN